MLHSLIVFAFIALVSGRSYKEASLELTNNIVYGMKTAAKSYSSMTKKDKLSAIAAIRLVQTDFPAVCGKVFLDSEIMLAESGSNNPKMAKFNTAFKSIKLMELGYLNLTVFAMHPELAKMATKANMGKRDLNDLMPSLDKRAWGSKGSKAQNALNQISKVEMDIMQAGLKVLESDDTLDLVVNAL